MGNSYRAGAHGWEFDWLPAAGPLAGTQLRNGSVQTHPRHGRGVRFRCPREAFARLAANPDLAALVGEAEALTERAARELAEGVRPLRVRNLRGDCDHWTADPEGLDCPPDVERRACELWLAARGVGLTDYTAGLRYASLAGHRLTSWVLTHYGAYGRGRGDDFTATLDEVLSLHLPAVGAAAAREAARGRRLEDARAEASRAGLPVEVSRWSEPCDGSQPECDLDLCRRVAHPDGRVTVERSHAH